MTLGTVTLEYDASTTAQDIYLNQPLSSTLAAGESTTFLVIVEPQTAGLHTAVVNIPNNDADENPFRIAVQGTGGPSLTVTTNGKYAKVTSNPGVISCGDQLLSCKEAFALNESVTLSIVPDAGASISSTWGGDCQGNTGNTCALVLDSNKSVSADFVCDNLVLSESVINEKTWGCTSINTGAGFLVSAPVSGITNKAILQATDFVVLGNETRVAPGGVLRVIVTP